MLLVLVSTLLHLQSVVHLPEAQLAACVLLGGLRQLLIFLERHLVIFNCLREVPSLIFACSSCESSIDMVRVDLKHFCEVSNTLIYHTHLLQCAAANVKCSCILGTQTHELITILNRFFQKSFLHPRGTSNEQGFLVAWVVLKFLRAYSNQVVNIECLSVNSGPGLVKEIVGIVIVRVEVFLLSNACNCIHALGRAAS